MEDPESVDTSTILPYFYTFDLSSSNSSLCSNSSQCEILHSLSSFLTQYNIWIVFAFGFPGNLISFFVIVRMCRQKISSSLLYVALLAVVDNVAIVLKIVMLQQMNGKLEMDPIRCKLLIFCGLTLVAYANWILIVMSAERYTAVGFPLKVGLIWSLRRAVSIIVLVFLFLCAVHLHLFFTIDGADRSCWPKQELLPFFHPWWFFISSSVFAFVPAISIIVFNILIIRLMHRSTFKRRSLMSSPNSGDRESRKQERQVTVMLVTLAVVFITLTIPRCVFTISKIYWLPKYEIGKARKEFIDVFTNSLADFNHAVNFYLYFFANTKFRIYIFGMARCREASKPAGLLSGGLLSPLSNLSFNRCSKTCVH